MVRSDNTRYLVIPAGGSGSRFEADLPKQFVPLAGKAVLMHAIGAFHAVYPDIEIIVVLPGQYLGLWDEMLREFSFEVPHRTVSGGPTRFHSVRNGLNAITGNDGIVGIHDGVRPFPGKDLILRCFGTAEEKGSAVPVLPLTDSIRRITPDRESTPLNREDYIAVQTPQCFRLEEIREAYDSVPDPAAFTDDASVYERFIRPVELVEGNPENIKVTRPVDLHFGESLVNRIRLR